MSDLANKFIDVKKVIKDKNPKLLKYLPRFVVSYLQKILREKQVNNFINNNVKSDGFLFSENSLKMLNLDVQSSGLQNVPKDSGVILACNHPIGGMDAMALIQAMKGHRKDIKFVVNDILLELKNLAELFVGVNKHGKNSAEALKHMNGVFGGGGATFVFPAGLVSRKKGKVIEDLEWKKTFVTRAKKFGVPVIPVYIDGSLSSFFYKLSNLREKVGVKANIEMLYLVDEQFRQKDKTIKIYFGELISPGFFTKEKSDRDWAQVIKKKVYQLKTE